MSVVARKPNQLHIIDFTDADDAAILAVINGAMEGLPPGVLLLLVGAFAGVLPVELSAHECDVAGFDAWAVDEGNGCLTVVG